MAINVGDTFNKHKKPVLKYAICLGLAVVIILGIIIVPKGDGELLDFLFIANSNGGDKNKEIALSKDAVQVVLDNDKKYHTEGAGGGGDGKTTTWHEQFDFNLHCTGKGINKVTYTANNCKFMKKTFLTKEQYERREGSGYVDGTIWGEQLDDKSWVYWGFSPIGTMYSADYLEEVNLNNFGLKITYIEENSNEFESFTKQEGVKQARLRAAAYDKAYITAEIEFEDGRKVTKIIKIGNKYENGSKVITAYFAN